MNNIRIEGIGLEKPFAPQKPTQIKENGFGEKLKAAISDVNSLQHEADFAMENVAKGELGVHEGMLAISKADLSLRLLVQVRNKVLEAYREISRM
jgi:flagellar hook-basal body complex protein FliE